MSQDRSNWFQRLWRRLGFGNQSLRVTAGPPLRSISIATKTAIDEKALTKLVDVILGNSTAAVNSASRPIDGRTWWNDPDQPEKEEKKVFQAWPRLVSLGSACEILSCIEVSAYPELTNALAAALLKFQYEETLLSDGDFCPLPWGALSYQTTVAIHNHVWVIHKRANNERHRTLQIAHKLNSWMESASEMAETRIGDLILIQLFYQGLERWRVATNEALEAANERYQTTNSALNLQYQILRKQFWPKSRRATRTKIDQARSEQQQAAKVRRELEVVLRELGTAVGEWRLFSPLTRLLESGNGRLVVKGKPLLLLPSLLQPGAEGFQRWVIRHMVRLTRPSDSVTSYLNEEVLRLLEEIKIDKAPDARDDATWYVLLFVLRFYSLWVSSCPALERLERDFPSVDKQRQKYYRSFFKHWRFLHHLMRDEPRERVPGYLPYAVFIMEYSQLQESIAEAEYWRDLRLETLEAKLDTVAAYLGYNQTRRVVEALETVEVEM